MKNSWQQNLTASEVSKVKTFFEFADEVKSVSKTKEQKRNYGMNKSGTLEVTYMFKGREQVSRISSRLGRMK